MVIDGHSSFFFFFFFGNKLWGDTHVWNFNQEKVTDHVMQALINAQVDDLPVVVRFLLQNCSKERADTVRFAFFLKWSFMNDYYDLLFSPLSLFSLLCYFKL